jgi:hypothetical protein
MPRLEELQCLLFHHLYCLFLFLMIVSLGDIIRLICDTIEDLCRLLSPSSK